MILLKLVLIEGTLLVPTFVLHELQLISDSADSIKRVPRSAWLRYFESNAKGS